MKNLERHTDSPTHLACLDGHDLACLKSGRPATSNAMISARDDMGAIGLWLAQYADRPNTYATYLREIRRFMLWCARIRNKPVSALCLDDYLAYRSFLADPPATWIGPRRPADHPDWKPFQAPLPDKSVRHALTVLNSLTGFLNEARYIDGNPLGLARSARRGEDSLAGRDKALDKAMREAAGQALASQEKEDGVSRLHAERTRLLFALGGYAGLRVSEIAGLRECDCLTRDIGGKLGYWLRIKGKGGKTARIPLAAPAVKAIARYRGYCGFSVFPVTSSTLPLLKRVNSARDGVGRTALYRDAKRIFMRGAERLEPHDSERAERLRQAGPHSLRHTFVTLLLDSGAPLPRVRSLARHASMNTTLIYSSETAESLAGVVADHIQPW